MGGAAVCRAYFGALIECVWGGGAAVCRAYFGALIECVCVWGGGCVGGGLLSVGLTLGHL